MIEKEGKKTHCSFCYAEKLRKPRGRDKELEQRLIYWQILTVNGLLVSLWPEESRAEAEAGATELSRAGVLAEGRQTEEVQKMKKS